VAADGCQGFEPGNVPAERQGILRYNGSSTDVPVSTRPDYDTTCRDESLDNLQPMLPWAVPPIMLDGKSLRSDSLMAHLSDSPGNTQRFNIGKDRFPDLPAKNDGFFWWAFGNNPMWLNFSDPTILNLQNTSWNKDYVVISEDAQKSPWIYLVVTAPKTPPEDTPIGRSYWPVAHPVSKLIPKQEIASLTTGTSRCICMATTLRSSRRATTPASSPCH
jgi:hypothetical protein